MRGEWLFPGAASPALYGGLDGIVAFKRIAKLKNHRGEHEERETNMKRANIIQILLGIVLVGVVPAIRAVVPPPDGGYPGGNTAEGQNALLSLTTGGFNTAIGFVSLRGDTTGSFNTATGAGTLLANTGESNSATGAGALLSNTTGHDNTADGAFALFGNTMGFRNVAAGAQALLNNTTGNQNIAIGYQALLSNTQGGENTAIGTFALFNTQGGGNTAIGFDTLFDHTTGVDNTAVGIDALDSLTSGNDNTALGTFAGANVVTANNVICINHTGADVSNSCFIGNIRGVTTQNADATNVVIDSAGQLGTMSSSRRFKREIKPMAQASEAILSLKPVMFQYRTDKSNTPQFGLVAEDVAAVNPDLVVRDKDGEIYSVRYEAVNAMLLNEFLKEHRTVQELKQEIAVLIATVKEQASQIQKVTARIEVSKTEPRTVATD
jgi:hypothetical protein